MIKNTELGYVRESFKKDTSLGYVRSLSNFDSTDEDIIPSVGPLYDLPSFTLQDDRTALQTLINAASTGSAGSHTVVNVTSQTVYACPGRLTTNLMNNYVDVIGDSDNVERVIVCGNIIPRNCIFRLDSRDALYSRFSESVLNLIYVVPLTAMGISMGAQFPNNAGPADNAERNVVEPIVCCLNGRALKLCCDTKDGLENWRVVATTGASTTTQIATMSEINGSNTYVHPASEVDLCAFIAQNNYSTRSMRFSSVASNVLTFSSTVTGMSGTLVSKKVKLLNAPEFLLEEGEYFVSWSTGRLYFIPWSGESINRFSVSVPFGEFTGTNRAGAIFDLVGNKGNALAFDEDRHNNIEGFTFEACYNAPLRIGRYCKAKRIKIYGARYSGIMAHNPHNVEISSCVFHDMWRGSIEASFNAQITSGQTQSYTINGYDSGGANVSKNRSFTLFNGFVLGTYDSVTIANNTILRSGTIWNDWSSCSLNATNVEVYGNTFQYLSHQAITVGPEATVEIYQNSFDRCCLSLTENGCIYSGRSWTTYAKIYENLFTNLRRVRSDSGEDYMTAIMWDDMGCGLLAYDNYIQNCDYGMQLNSSPSQISNNIFDNVGQSFVNIKFRAYNADLRENYTSTSLRDQGILDKIVALKSVSNPINFTTHPMFFQDGASTITGDLVTEFYAQYVNSYNLISPTPSGTREARAITDAMINMPLEAADIAGDASDNLVGRRYMRNYITINYHSSQFINGSTMTAFSDTASYSITINELPSRPASYWDDHIPL